MDVLKKIMRLVALIILLSFLSGCMFATPWRLDYLRQAKDHATQDEIAEKLGPPLATYKLDNGSVVWMYRYTRSYVESQPDFDFGGQAVSRKFLCRGSWCAEYILTFDKNKILRNLVWQGYY